MEALREADTYIEPFLGWRAWFVINGAYEPRLTSIAHRTTWRPRRPERAICQTDSSMQQPCKVSMVPRLDCWCGIYAFKERIQIEKAVSRWFGQRRECFVIGQVSMWGRMIEFTRGYRAQYAYPKNLIHVMHPWDDTPVAQRPDLSAYGVPQEICFYEWSGYFPDALLTPVAHTVDRTSPEGSRGSMELPF